MNDGCVGGYSSGIYSLSNICALRTQKGQYSVFSKSENMGTILIELYLQMSLMTLIVYW